ncbi:unnamed protein product, partial [Thlaspi arvense]
DTNDHKKPNNQTEESIIWFSSVNQSHLKNNSFELGICFERDGFLNHAHFSGSWQHHNYRALSRQMRRKPVQNSGMTSVFGMDKRYWFIPGYTEEDLKRMPELQGLEYPSKHDFDSH